MTVAPTDPGHAGGVVISHMEITRCKESVQALEASERRFRAMFDNAAVGIAEVAPNGKLLRVNDHLRRTLGYSNEALVATTYANITHSDDTDADAAQQELLQSKGADAYSIEKRLLREDGSYVWVNATLSCVRNTDAEIDYFILLIEDITERKLAERRQNTLLREVAHRGKNLLAVIEAIASNSLSGDYTMEEAEAAFIGRLHALAQTYDTLTNQAFDGAAVDGVLKNELAAFGDRVRVQGPGVILTPKAAQTFALIVHELATNASKHGSLSVPNGRLVVSWQLLGTASDRTMLFEWREEGGLPAAAPTRFGFGSTLLDSIAGLEFGCQPGLSYAPEGFRYRFEAALARLGAEQVESPVRRRLVTPIMCSFYDSWARHRGSPGSLPSLKNFDWTRFAATGGLTIATVEPGGTVRFTQVGRTLIAELGRQPDEGLEDFGTAGLTEAYLRCAEKREPTHELLRFNFGNDDRLTFERLLVPFCATAGRAVTHIVGLAVYNGHTRLLNSAGPSRTDTTVG